MDPKMYQTLKSADRDFEAAIIATLKDLRK